MSAPTFEGREPGEVREAVDALDFADAIESVVKVMMASSSCYHVEEFRCALELVEVAQRKIAELVDEVRFTVADEKEAAQ